MKSIDEQSKSKIRDEALLNEYKGNLFEYLLALNLAGRYDIKDKFLMGLSSESKQILSHYERQLKKMAPGLAKLLISQSSSLGKELFSYLPKQSNGIWVIGKENNHQKIEKWNEADILIKSGHDITPISIKLCRTGSYINTKSGGVSSFLSKYFKSFDIAISLQEELNEIIHFNYLLMARRLYQAVGLEYDEASFDSWREKGFPELPGALPQELKKIVNDSYIPISDFIFKSFKKFLEIDREKFKKCLLPLAGFSSEDIIQAILYHSHNSEYSKQVEKSCHIQTYSHFEKEIESFTINKKIRQKAYFYLDFISKSIQVRIKPMNKFTSKSFKVNCSVKHRIN